jgi:osmotically-inducible protein OsmY
MNRLLLILAFLSLTGMILAAHEPSGNPPNASPIASAAAQKAEPNSQAPATPQTNTGQTPTPSAQGHAANGTTATAGQPNTGDDAALQGRIQEALRNEPGLAASHISVNVTDSAIEISGTVPSGKDKQTAERIAQSFNGNRKFEDKLLVTGQPSAAPGSANPSAPNPR